MRFSAYVVMIREWGRHPFLMYAKKTAERIRGLLKSFSKN